MEKLMEKIMSKAYEVTKNTKHDVFVIFYGHVNSIDVYYSKNGWSEDNVDDKIDIASINLESEKAIEKLQQCLQKLEELEKQ